LDRNASPTGNTGDDDHEALTGFEFDDVKND